MRFYTRKVTFRCTSCARSGIARKVTFLRFYRRNVTVRDIR